MKKLKLSGKDLRALGFPQAPVIRVAIEVVAKAFREAEKEKAVELLKKLLHIPEDFYEDETLFPIARLLKPPVPLSSQIPLNDKGVNLNIFGEEHIDDSALSQIRIAARLPVSKAAALMPDAHSGYGLPIGGVLATKNAVIPYGVGVDIGCRMCLSIFDIPVGDLQKKVELFADELLRATLFGTGGEFAVPADHEVLEDPLFDEIPLLAGLQDRARRQLGTSGSGNHFVEFGEVKISGKDDLPGLEPGLYVGLLSHSGSRNLGASVANHYTKLAAEKRRLPAEARNLAWLDLNEEAGHEYWLAMNLAGRYASACHHAIHQKIAQQFNRQPIAMVENHHNFAWKETYHGEEWIVHRKGATPAGKNVLGIIPGSMTAPGFIVKGKGEEASLNSASHGAGRVMSRTQAMKNITQQQLKQELEKHNVRLLGAGLDEAPFAYKDIEKVMKSQKLLVDVVGKFQPKIVKMDSGSRGRGRG